MANSRNPKGHTVWKRSFRDYYGKQLRDAEEGLLRVKRKEIELARQVASDTEHLPVQQATLMQDEIENLEPDVDQRLRQLGWLSRQRTYYEDRHYFLMRVRSDDSDAGSIFLEEYRLAHKNHGTALGGLLRDALKPSTGSSGNYQGDTSEE